MNSNTLKQLNEQFGIKHHLGFEQNENKFIIINVINQSAKAKISTYGGQVLSFLPQGQQQDLLFLSKKAIYQQGKAIRGGIPICWPWFADNLSGLGRPAHGFARNQNWDLVATAKNPDGSTRITLSLQNSDDTLAIWPYEFKLELKITVGEKLNIKLTTTNTGTKSFEITQALHAYLNIGDIRHIAITDLNDIKYVDKKDSFIQKIQSDELIITGETDHVYLSPPPEIIVNDFTLKRKLLLESKNSKTAVIWNPWEGATEKMIDLGDEDYKYFVGVEVANANRDTVTIPAGNSYCLQADYGIISD